MDDLVHPKVVENICHDDVMNFPIVHKRYFHALCLKELYHEHK
jgi:hypothetical protein